MIHDIFSGQLTSVQYIDLPKSEEVVSALNDDQEIDDILQQVCDPLQVQENEE